jgi:hypothetical protein
MLSLRRSAQTDPITEEAALALVKEAEHQSRATTLAAEKKERALILAAEQKTVRDARYAARKARHRLDRNWCRRRTCRMDDNWTAHRAGPRC